jgi:hypothetical protein
MGDMNFIPYWYYEKIKNKKIRVLSILLVLLFIFDILIFYSCMFHIKKYRSISDDINITAEKISAMKKDNFGKINPEYDIDKSINIFQNSIQGKIEYSSVDISDNKIYLQVPALSNTILMDTIDVLDDIKDADIQRIESDNVDKLFQNTIRIELRVK